MKRSDAQRAADAERWVAARRTGLSVDAIAAAAHVGSGTVSRATVAFGPFSPPPVPKRTTAEFLTVDDVAAELAVGPNVAYQLIRNGTLPARRGGAGRYEVERGMFERWIVEQHRLTREWIAANPGNFAGGG